MNSFVAKHRSEINGVLECFDRVILRGHLPIAGVGYFSTWLFSKRIALNMRQLLGGMVELQGRGPVVCREIEGPRSGCWQSKTGRPYRHLPCAERMEENARELAQQDGITDGLVCVYGAMETCRTFRVHYHEDGPKVLRGPARLLGHLLLLDGSGIRLDAREAPDLVSLHGASVCQRPRVAGTEARRPRNRL